MADVTYLVSAGGDSSQDETEEEAKAITVKIYPNVHNLVISLALCTNVNVTLQVRFARPESEQARQRRIQSYEFLQKKQAEEPWVHLHYHGVKVGGALVTILLSSVYFFFFLDTSYGYMRKIS